MDLDSDNRVLRQPRRRLEPLGSPQYILLDNGELAVKVTERAVEPENAPHRLVPIKRVPQHDERVMQSIEMPGRNPQDGRSQEIWLNHNAASSARINVDQVSASRRPVTPDPRIIDLSADTPVATRHRDNNSNIGATEGRPVFSSSVQLQGRLPMSESQIRLRPDMRAEPVEVVYARKSPDRRDASDYHTSLGRPEQAYQRRTLPAHDRRVLVPDHQTLISDHGYQSVQHTKHSLVEQSSFSQSQFRPLSAVNGGVSHPSSLIPVHYEPMSPKYGSPHVSSSRAVVPVSHNQLRDKDGVRIIRSESAMMSKMDNLHLRPEQPSDTGSSTRYVPTSATTAQRPLQDHGFGSSVRLQAQPMPLGRGAQSPWDGRATPAGPVNGNQWSRTRIVANEDLARDVPLAMYDARPLSATNQSRFVLQRQHQLGGDQSHGYDRGHDEGLQPMVTQINQPYVSDARKT